MAYEKSFIARLTKTDMSSVGGALAKQCIELDISVKELADAVGVSTVTVYNWFYGTTTPRLDSYLKAIQYIEEIKVELDA